MHELELLSDGQAAFFSARVPAWHRLGTVTPGALTSQEALATARLGGWEVQKRPAMTTSPSGQPVAVPGRYVTIRNNPDPQGPAFDALGVVGEDYRVIQNEAAFAFLNDLARSEGAIFETAGSLQGGRKVFVTMRLPEPVRIAGDDTLALHVAVTTGHDGDAGFAAVPTPVRVVCQNTLTLALKRAPRVERVRHDTRAKEQMRRARLVLQHTLDEGATLQAAAQEMLRQKVADEEFDRIIAAEFAPVEPGASTVVRDRRLVQQHELQWLFRRSETQEVGRGTAWGAFNAVAEWAEWSRPAQARSKAAAGSVLHGKAAGIRRQAFRVFGPQELAMV